ncbi:MAG: topA [Phycisphaerales bacterium]|nr:topA [Phycisphaerales bacterium]
MPRPTAAREPPSRPGQDADVRSALRRGKLKYADPDAPGIARRRSGRAFRFVGPAGAAVRDVPTLARIRKLAVPPAWRDVWISPDPDAHIQAVGRDARGRKQYRYHEGWRRVRDEAKYGHVVEFAQALPAIRAAARRHLKLPGLPKQKVLAAVVLVMEKTLIRVGNEQYARQNSSYGLTTLQDRHAKVSGEGVKFRFRGKSGVDHDIDLDDPELADIVRRCRELPGQELFQYVDEAGRVRDIGSADVNDYLRSVSGHDFTAKDYRTWAGTVLAAKALRGFETAVAAKANTAGTATARQKGKAGVGKTPANDAAGVQPLPPPRGLKKHMVAAIETVAARLGNTKAVCRKCYIHPAVLDAYLDGSLATKLKDDVAAELKTARRRGLNADEESVLRMLQRTL